MIEHMQLEIALFGLYRSRSPETISRHLKRLGECKRKTNLSSAIFCSWSSFLCCCRSFGRMGQLPHRSRSTALGLGASETAIGWFSAVGPRDCSCERSLSSRLRNAPTPTRGPTGASDSPEKVQMEQQCFELFLEQNWCPFGFLSYPSYLSWICRNSVISKAFITRYGVEQPRRNFMSGFTHY